MFALLTSLVEVGVVAFLVCRGICAEPMVGVEYTMHRSPPPFRTAHKVKPQRLLTLQDKRPREQDTFCSRSYLRGSSKWSSGQANYHRSSAAWLGPSSSTRDFDVVVRLEARCGIIEHSLLGVWSLSAGPELAIKKPRHSCPGAFFVTCFPVR